MIRRTKNLQKCFTMGGFLLELISEQFNVHGFQASPWYLAEMITTKQGTRRESSTIANKDKNATNTHNLDTFSRNIMKTQ